MKSYDVIVLGAGIAGLSVARELAKRKVKALLLEVEEEGGKTSRAAAGILDAYTEATRETPLFQLGLKALEDYPAFLQEMGQKIPSQVEYEKLGILYLAVKTEDEELLKDRFQWQKKRGLPVEWVPTAKIRKMEPAVSSRVVGGIFYSEIPKISAQKLTDALLNSAQQSGAEIRTGLKKISVWLEKEKVRGVEAEGKPIESPVVVLASGCWAGLHKNLGIQLKISSVRGQILILRSNKSFEPTHILHTLRWAYIVPWPGNRLLIGSTLESNAGFENRVTPEGKEDILERVSEIYEGIQSLPVEKSWAGLRPYAHGSIPLVGPSRIKGLILALGYYRSGILISPLVGKLLAEGIVEGEFSPLLEPFYPK